MPRRVGEAGAIAVVGGGCEDEHSGFSDILESVFDALDAVMEPER